MTKTTDKENDPIATFVLAVAGAGRRADALSVAYELAVALALSSLKVVILADKPPVRGLDSSSRDRSLRWDLNKGVDESLIHLTGEVELLPQADRLMDGLSESERESVEQVLVTLEERFDHILIHIPDGISHAALQLLRMAPNLLLVITPEPAALTDAFSLLRVLHSSGGRPRILVLTHSVSSREEGVALYKRFETLVTVRLPVYLHHIGSLPPESIDRTGKLPVIMQDRHSTAGRALGHLALELETIRLESVPKEGLSKNWRDVVWEEEDQPVQPLMQSPAPLLRGADLIQHCLTQIEAAWRSGEVTRSDLQHLVRRTEALLEEARVSEAAKKEIEELRRASLEAAQLGCYETQQDTGETT